jgi:hypothetical protein
VIVETVSLDAGVGGIADNANPEASRGPRVEVIVTVQTIVYRETTEFRNLVAGQAFSIQQTVEESTLDHLNPQSTVTVWGRKSGDRVIADVFLYMNPLMIRKP